MRYWLALPSPLCKVTISPGTVSSNWPGRYCGASCNSRSSTTPSLAVSAVPNSARRWAVTVISRSKGGADPDVPAELESDSLPSAQVAEAALNMTSVAAIALGDADFFIPSPFDRLRSCYGQNSAVDAQNMNISKYRITDKTNWIFVLRQQQSAEWLCAGARARDTSVRGAASNGGGQLRRGYAVCSIQR